MTTGTGLRQLTSQGKQPKVMVARNNGTVYGAIVVLEPHALPLAIYQPGTDEVMEFDSLDEVASFLAQVGIKQFQVSI